MNRIFTIIKIIILIAPLIPEVFAARSLPDGLVVTTDHSVVRLRVIGDKIIRVSAVPHGDFPSGESLAVLPSCASQCQFSQRSEPGKIYLSTTAVTAVVNTENGSVSFLRPDGSVILCENSDGRSFTPIEVEGTKGYTVRQTFSSPHVMEAIYGLGQHQSNEFNYKGKDEQLYQYNTKVSVPFVVSTANYGILWDSASLCRWGNPADYSQLGEVFTLYDKEGNPGALTGIYTSKKGDVFQRSETSLFFEHLIRGDLGHVVNLPRNFNLSGSKVVYEGEIEAPETGEYRFIHYYSGYQTVILGGDTVVDTRWRTAWNPNSYKFSVNLRKGERVPLRLEWEPDGGVAYCGLRAYPTTSVPADGELSWWGEMQDMIDYYFIAGDSMDDVIGGYRCLTGKSPVMPAWAMGFWQSREKYNSRKELLSTLSEFRRRSIPIDNIVIDWLHWPQDSWGSHEFDPKRFPAPREMMDSVHSLDARVMVSVWPKFYESTKHFREFDRNGWMYRLPLTDSIRDWVGPGYLGSFYDAYHPEARKLFWSQLAEHYLPLGIDAWWMDASEPNIRDCTDIQYRKDLMSPTALGPSAKYFNAYALMNAQAIYDGQRSTDPDRRVFLLTRSGFAGLQRYSTATWSGDIASRWEDMEAQIPAGLNFSMSGIPWWTMDIGGFCVENRYVKAQKLFDQTGEENADLREWRELNARWYQFGAFVPLFRAHGQFPFREPWNIAPEGHPANESIVESIRLRYSLLPYIYSLAGKTYFDDYSIMRPMAMDFGSDPATLSLKDQYMFGPSFLVAPICRYGARSREVYLPAGCDWYDFHTGTRHSGGMYISAEAPLERMPLFVPAGAVIPSGGPIQSTAEVDSSPLVISVYAGSDGEFTLYDDERLNYNYEKGMFTRIPMVYDDSASTLTLGDREGIFPGMRNEIPLVIRLFSDSTAAPIEKTTIYNGKKQTIKL